MPPDRRGRLTGRHTLDFVGDPGAAVSDRSGTGGFGAGTEAAAGRPALLAAVGGSANRSSCTGPGFGRPLMARR